MGKIIVKVNNLSFKYPDSNEGIFNINFNIGEGEVILLTGNSGSGKTTLIKCLNGLIPHLYDGEYNGQIIINDVEVAKEKMAIVNENIGSVFQNPRSQFFTNNSTSELVFTMENYGYDKQMMENNLNQLVEEFKIKHLLNRDLFNLSSGERQLVALASAKSLNQRIMIFDEPSANLDYARTMQLSKIIKKLKQEKTTIIIADHRFYYLNDVVDRVFLMNGGKLNIFDNVEDFKSSDYDTRNFDLFNLKFLSREKINNKNKVADLKNVTFKDILEDINLNFYNREVMAVVGNNGVGKTTLAKILTKSIKPTKGEINTSGLPFYIMQDADYQLFGYSLAQELKITDKNIKEEKIDNILNDFNLFKYKDCHPLDLSGGQKQRLQIALSLITNSELIIFDEPTSGLDINAMNRVVNQIKELRKRKGVIVISHDYEFISKIADRIVYLKNKKIVDDFLLNVENIERFNNIFKDMEG